MLGEDCGGGGRKVGEVGALMVGGGFCPCMRADGWRFTNDFFLPQNQRRGQRSGAEIPEARRHTTKTVPLRLFT